MSVCDLSNYVVMSRLHALMIDKFNTPWTVCVPVPKEIGKEHHMHFMNGSIMEFIHHQVQVNDQIRSFDVSSLNEVPEKNTSILSMEWIDETISMHFTETMFNKVSRAIYSNFIENIFRTCKVLLNHFGLQTYLNVHRYHKRLHEKGYALLDVMSNPSTFEIFKKQEDGTEKKIIFKLPNAVFLTEHELIEIFTRHEEVVGNFECPVCFKRNVRRHEEIVYCLECFNHLDIGCLKKSDFKCPFCRTEVLKRKIKTGSELFISEVGFSNIEKKHIIWHLQTSDYTSNFETVLEQIIRLNETDKYTAFDKNPFAC